MADKRSILITGATGQQGGAIINALSGSGLRLSGMTRKPESPGLGRAIQYVQIPMADVRKNSEDLALMLEWFERVGYNADIAATEKEFGVRSTTFAAWAAREGVTSP